MLESLFLEFVKFIERKDKQPFVGFNESNFIDREENYKYSLYEEARENLGNKWWKPEDIGTNKIKESVTSAIKAKVEHLHQSIDNNLVNWRQKDDLINKNKSKELESAFFDLYKSKVSDEQSFERLIKEKISYQFIAYLFFIKDRNRFLPISQEKFDQIFELVGLSDFRTTRNISWENYSTFIAIIKQVRDFLRTKDRNATLLDAHSFLWILGNQMKAETTANSLANRSTSKEGIEKVKVEVPPAGIEPVEPYIAEEEDALVFPEGKEVFRLHRLKERNKELVKAAKERRLETDARLCCQVCGFSFVDKYGELGEGFIEAHHLFPISQLKEETKTKLDDLALVCSNCHRMLHRKRPWVTLQELKNIVQ